MTKSNNIPNINGSVGTETPTLMSKSSSFTDKGVVNAIRSINLSNEKKNQNPINSNNGKKLK